MKEDERGVRTLMRQRMKLLILTASYGEGHLQVSRALQQKFQENGVWDIRLVDLFEEAHPVLNSITKFLYRKSAAVSAYGLDYYGWSYYMTRDMDNDSALARWINLLGLRKLLAVVKAERPNAVISTFPFGGIREYLRKFGVSVSTFTVITDFTLHNRWLYSVPDKFYVATEDLKQAMVERGIPDSQITVSGIPIREQFHDNVFAESDTPDGGARQRSVLIMAAAYGLRDVKKMIGHLSAIPNVRINVVCGRNAKLKETLECCYRSQDHIGIFGFVERIARLMGESSCIVTKAGGVTLSEAIQMNVPPLIYKPFPGQEKENARYLAGVGAACVVHSAGELAARVRELLFNERFSQNMKEKIRSLKKDNAADTIVQDVLRFIDRQSDVSAS